MKDSKLFNLNNINELNDDLYLPISNINSPLQFTYLGVVKEYIADGLNSQILDNSNKILELEQNISDINVPTKISELENDKGYLVKVILTQAEYDALETKDPNALYVISDANETEDNNFVTESQLDSRGFLTQTDKSELNEYDQFLLNKIENIDLSNYLTIDENKKNELVISTALNDLLSKITVLESQLSTAMTKISVLEQELAKTLIIN